MRTLNIGPGNDTWGTDKLDLHPQSREVKQFNLNGEKRLPYGDGTFSEVRLHAVLEFCIDPQLWINECHRVLRKGGKLDVIIFNIESLRFYLRPLRGRYAKGAAAWSEELRYNMTDPHTVENRLRHAGFKIVSMSRFSGLKFPYSVFKDRVAIVAQK